MNEAQVIVVPFYIFGLFVPILINAAMVVWLFSALNQRVKTMEQEIASLKRDNSAATIQLNGLAITLARVDEKVIRLLHENAGAAAQPA